MAYKDPSGNWFEGLFDTWDYRDTGNPASDALANTTTAIVNTPASLLNAGLEGLRQIGELVAPHEPAITNFTVSTPVPHDDVLAAGVKVVAAASKLPTGKLGGNFVKIGEASAGVGGRFADLVALGVKGDKLTPHHMPQAAARFTNRADGGALMMTETEHKLTRTYGFKGARTAQEESGMAFRDVLARDIRDVRDIVGSKYNSGVREMLNYYQANFPKLMKK